MTELPPELLMGLPAVLAAERSGSATRAAAALETTTATVLRRIEAMERALGVTLFVRMPTGLQPTAALEVVLPWAEQCTESLDGMRRDVAGLVASPSGNVRIAVPPVVANHTLIPGLGELCGRYPGITVEIAATTEVVDLTRREADLAVRVIQPTTGDLVMRKLLDYRMVVACSPSLAASYDSLDELPWLSWDRSMEHIPEAAWLRTTFPNARIAMRAAELTTLLAAARAGVGALLVAEPLAAREGGLVRVSDLRSEVRGSLWLVAHQALRELTRVALVWDWILAQFKDESPLLPSG